MKRTGKYNYRYMSDTIEGGEELIPTVIVQFHDYMDIWMTKEMYDNEGKFIGLMRLLGLPFNAVKRVHKLLKHPSSYPTAEWEP